MALKANELKINNWVKYAGKFMQITMVELLDNDKFYVRLEGELPKINGTLIEAIEIDSNTINKIKNHKIKFDEDMNQFDFEIHKDLIFKIFNSKGENEVFLNCQYVHQLQNFSFAVTGQEIIIDF